MTNKGRRLHNWGFIEDRSAAELEVRCLNCGLIERTGYYVGAQGRTVGVIQWITPQGRLLCIRPVRHLRPGPALGTIADAFPGVPVAGSPQCPKSVEAWTEQS